MNEPITVEIERTRRREIIKAALTGYIPPSLRDESAEKLKVSDHEIKDFLISLAPAELRRMSEGKLGPQFQKNANAALARLADVASKPFRKVAKRSTQGPGVLLDFADNEVLKSYLEKSKK